MLNKKRIAVIIGAAISLVLFGIILGWRLHGPTKGAEEVAKFIEAVAPKPSTESDWKAVSFIAASASIRGSELPVITVKNVRPILEGDALMAAMHLSVQNTRNDVEQTTKIWSRKANRALEFNWLSHAVKPIEKPAVEEKFYLGPEAQPGNIKFDYGYSISATPDKTGKKELIFRTPSGKSVLEWKRSSILSQPYFFKNYRYGAILERDDESKLIKSLVILDMDNREVAGIVELPPQVGRYPPLIVLDPNTDLLLCFDLDIAWIVHVDLRKIVDQSAKPWPPSWPNPFLGSWHGNDDVQRGRFSQLSEGSEPPPRPENYP